MMENESLRGAWAALERSFNAERDQIEARRRFAAARRGKLTTSAPEYELISEWITLPEGAARHKEERAARQPEAVG